MRFVKSNSTEELFRNENRQKKFSIGKELSQSLHSHLIVGVYQ